MPTTLTRGATTLTLPDDLLWTDEFAWAAGAASRSYGAGGAMFVDTGTRLAGRPITLAGSAQHAWMTRADALTLRGWTDDPVTAMTLVYRSTTYTVLWDLAQRPLEATPLVDYANPQSTDFYWLTLRLIQAA